MVSHGPTLLPPPGFTQLPNFSGIVPASDQSPSQGTLPAVCLPPHLYTPSGFQESRSLLAQDWLPCSRRGGSCEVTITDPALLQSPAATIPGTLLAHTISLPFIFKHPLPSLASKLHIRWYSLCCSLCSSDDQLGVPVGSMSKWV